MYSSVGGYHLPAEEVVPSTAEVAAATAGTRQDIGTGSHIPGREAGVEVAIGDAGCHVADLNCGRALDAEAAATELFHRIDQDCFLPAIERIGNPKAYVAVGERLLATHPQGSSVEVGLSLSCGHKQLVGHRIEYHAQDDLRLLHQGDAYGV